MKRLALLTILMTVLLATGQSRAHTLRVADGSYITLPELIAELRQVDLVFMGELHNHAGHHLAQLQIIKALHEAGEPVAVGLEMFRSNDQKYLDQWVAGELTMRQFLPIYQQNWSMWELYRDIFVYARDKRIPMIGLNINREVTQQVAQEGFGSLSPEQLDELPPIRCDIDHRYEEFIRRAHGAHHHEGDFLSFCEAQMVWDNVMAENLLAFHRANPEHTVVVLAGSGHAWKHGIPEQIERRTDQIAYRVLLPEIPGRISPENATVEEADFLMLGLEEGPLH
jgi:uncharacterized iron-regulated protein